MRKKKQKAEKSTPEQGQLKKKSQGVMTMGKMSDDFSSESGKDRRHERENRSLAMNGLVSGKQVPEGFASVTHGQFDVLESGLGSDFVPVFVVYRVTLHELEDGGGIARQQDSGINDP